jgi:hypothetical protein
MLKTRTKIGLVISGYFVALLIAYVVVAIYVAATSGPDRQTSGGMYAFGDSLLFLAVFGVVAVPPTGAALFFLRPYRSFWLALAITALALATTAIAAFIDYAASRSAGAGFVVHDWSALAVLRIIVAPLFALAFFVAVLFAPNRSSRSALLVATVIEAAVFAYVALIWFCPFWSF